MKKNGFWKPYHQKWERQKKKKEKKKPDISTFGFQYVAKM
jgi:hypothetical protein